MSLKFRFSRRFLVCALLTLLWMTVIFLFSSQNGEESAGLSAQLLAFLCGIFHYTPSPDTASLLTLLLRKAAHMTEFGILALLWLGTLRSGFGRFRGMYPAAFAAASLYAATDELHQLFVNERAGQFADWLIDSAGALLFLLAVWVIARFMRRPTQEKGNNR